ncbi:MAG TPA: hypothetical protein VH593_12900 [Ktedonobacteraceae bacterium]|jgi:hypothetical protein
MPVRKVYVKARHDAALRRDKVIKWIMLLCASIAFILGLIACYMFVNIFINAPASTYGGTGAEFFCEHGPCGSPTSHLPPPSYFPAPLFALGYGLCSLIAFLVGFGHAIAHHAWRWVGYFLSPPLLLLISLVFLLLIFNPLSFSLSGLVSFLVFLLLLVAVAFLVPVVCLAYAILLDDDE